MKNKIAFIVLLINCLCIYAQSKRFYYEISFKKDSTAQKMAKDIGVLEINKDSNVFLSNEYIVTDSLNSINKDNQLFAYPEFKTVVEYIKSNNSFNIIQNLSMNYYQFNVKNEINWTIQSDKKKIGNFEVTKATAEYGGRKWIAWFSSEIPFPFGPYIFYGLPGLILDIYDDKENFHFSFIQNKNYDFQLSSDEIIKHLFENRKINIKEKEWEKIQLNYFNNPLAEYKSGKAVMVKDSGEQYNSNDYRNLEKKIQDQIRKFNNPIELDEAVIYPEK